MELGGEVGMSDVLLPDAQGPTHRETFTRLAFSEARGPNRVAAEHHVYITVHGAERIPCMRDYRKRKAATKKGDRRVTWFSVRVGAPLRMPVLSSARPAFGGGLHRRILGITCLKYVSTLPQVLQNIRARGVTIERHRIMVRTVYIQCGGIEADRRQRCAGSTSACLS